VATEDNEYIKGLNESRMKIWERGKEILERAAAEKRSMSAEEATQYEALTADITRLDKTRERTWLATAERSSRVNEELRGHHPVEGPTCPDSRRADPGFFRSEIRTRGTNGLEIDLTHPARIYEGFRAGMRLQELRAVIATDSGASGGSLTVPTTVANRIYAFMTAQVAMRRIGCTIITTAGGNAMNFPRVSTHGVATQIANQDTAFGGTNPVLSMMTLNAYDYGSS
jgi:HK97 family phage major capsid protein